MKKLFLLLIGCLLFSSVFAAGKFDYDTTFIENLYTKNLVQYHETPRNCLPLSGGEQELKLIATDFISSQTDRDAFCQRDIQYNNNYLEFYAFHGTNKEKESLYKYASDFVNKYRGKKDISNTETNNILTTIIGNYKYGCAFVNNSMVRGINLIHEYNDDKYGYLYNKYANGETFIYNDTNFPVLDDLSRIGRRMDRLCPYPDGGINFIKENAQEMSNDMYGVAGQITNEEKTKIISDSLVRGYIPFEERYITHPIGNNTNITTNNTVPQISYNNPQLKQAVTWMNGSGLTKFDNPKDFMANQSLRRDEASKFFVQYAMQVQKLVPDETKTECNKFSDLNKGRPDLKETIKNACKLGLFQGYNGEFMPNELLTNEQAITVLIRLIDGKKDESGTHFGQKYFEKAQQLGIMSGLSLNSSSNFDRLSSRGEIGMLLYSTNTIVANNIINNITITTNNIINAPITNTTIINTNIINPVNPVITTSINCSINQHLEGNSCILNTKSCIQTNGIGQQIWNGNSRGSCSLVSCNNGYQILNNSCITISQQTITPQQTVSGCYSGRVTFDYAKGDRSYLLGAGSTMFKTERSMRSDNTIYSYANSPLKGNALVAANITAIKDIIDASQYTYSDDNKAPTEGQIVLFKNANNIYMALKIIDIANGGSNQSLTGILTFDYIIQGDGSTSFANCFLPSSSQTTVYLSDLNRESATIGWKSIGKDISVDGHPLKLNGIMYNKGIGTHANSEIIYNLGGNYSKFESEIGIDSEMISNGSVIFQVYLDNTKAFDSGLMKWDSIKKLVNLNVGGVNKLKLIVTDSGNGMDSDHADWADAKLTSN